MFKFTGRQLAFWQELTAPFPNEAYKWRAGPGGKKFTYVQSRTLMNRLDDVCGPQGWNHRFEPTEKGVSCVLEIMAPGGGESDFTLALRAGLGSWADLNNDEDAEFKSAGTSAFKAACSAAGIARDLYDEGMPSYWTSKYGGFASGTPQPSLPDGAPTTHVSPNHNPTFQPGDNRQQAAAAPVTNGAPSGNGGPAPGGRREFGNEPPFGKVGKAVYAWSKKMSDLFQVDVLGKMTDYAKKNGQSPFTDNWTQEFSDSVLLMVVEWLKTLSTYKGQFDGTGVSPTAAPVAAVAAAVSPTGFPDLHPQRKAIADAVVALLTKVYQRAPSQGEVIAKIGEVGASVPNAKGHRGEVLESLKLCEDAKWLANILAEVRRATADHARLEATAAPDDDDMPF